MEDAVLQSNRFFFSICQKHICCVIFYWHTMINNPVHFKIFVWDLPSICLHTYKITMIFHPLLWKVFPLLSSTRLLIRPYLHTPTLPPSPSFFFITMHNKTSTIRTPRRNESVHMSGGGILFHYKSPTIIDKHQARLYSFWSLKFARAHIHRQNFFLETPSIIIYSQYTCRSKQKLPLGV